MPCKDLSGEIFGNLIVVDRERDPKYRIQDAAVWYCLCECGGFKRTTTYGLTVKGISDCGCVCKDRGNRKLALIGQDFGYLRVIKAIKNIKGRTAWMTQCECGRYRAVLTSLLTSGKITHCGCKKTFKGGRRPDYVYEEIEGMCKIPRKQGG